MAAGERPFDIEDIGSFSRALGITFTREERGRVEGTMPIDAWKRQPAGFPARRGHDLAARVARLAGERPDDRP